MAGATGGTPGLPMPSGGPSLSTTSTCSARGASGIRTSRYVSKLDSSVTPAFIVEPPRDPWPPVWTEILGMRSQPAFVSGLVRT